MTRRTSQALAVAALIGAGVFAVPAAAQASAIYPPSDACRLNPSTTTAGSTVVFSCADGTFGANENVKITVTGENGSGTSFGFVRFAVSTGAYDTTAGAAGELADTSITLASDASGIYNIAAISASSAGGTASVTVTSAEGGLPSTGGDVQTVGLWAGGALVLIAGGAIAVSAAVRRRTAR